MGSSYVIQGGLNLFVLEEGRRIAQIVRLRLICMPDFTSVWGFRQRLRLMLWLFQSARSSDRSPEAAVGVQVMILPGALPGSDRRADCLHCVVVDIGEVAVKGRKRRFVVLWKASLTREVCHPELAEIRGLGLLSGAVHLPNRYSNGNTLYHWIIPSNLWRLGSLITLIRYIRIKAF